MKLIHLGGRYGSIIGNSAIVDDNDFEWLNQYKWYAAKTPNNYYAVRRIRKVNGKQTGILMHRQILELTDSKVFGDHMDGNSLNCQRLNLRIANRSQNSSNRKSLKHKRYLGVHYSKARKKWIAQVQHNHQYYNSHYFESEDDAALAYNEMALKFHGEFAHLNILLPITAPYDEGSVATKLNS